MVSNLLAYYEKVVLDSLLQINYGVWVARQIVGGCQRAKGTKEAYELPYKGNH